MDLRRVAAGGLTVAGAAALYAFAALGASGGAGGEAGAFPLPARDALAAPFRADPGLLYIALAGLLAVAGAVTLALTSPRRTDGESRGGSRVGADVVFLATAFLAALAVAAVPAGVRRGFPDGALGALLGIAALEAAAALALAPFAFRAPRRMAVLAPGLVLLALAAGGAAAAVAFGAGG